MEWWQQDVETATSFLFDHVDRLLSDGQFEECDRFLAAIPVQDLPSQLVRSVMVASSWAKDLPSRGKLAQAAWDRMVALRGLDVAEKLLGRMMP